MVSVNDCLCSFISILVSASAFLATAPQIWCCNTVKEVKGLCSKVALLLAAERDPPWITPLWCLFSCQRHVWWKSQSTTGAAHEHLCKDRRSVPSDEVAVGSSRGPGAGKIRLHSTIADSCDCDISTTFSWAIMCIFITASHKHCVTNILARCQAAVALGSYELSTHKLAVVRLLVLIF